MKSVSYAGLKVDTLDARFPTPDRIAYTDTDRENINPRSKCPLRHSTRGGTESCATSIRGTERSAIRVQGVFGVQSANARSSAVHIADGRQDPTPSPLRRDVTLDSVYAQVQVAPDLRPDSFKVGRVMTIMRPSVVIPRARWLLHGSATGSTIVRGNPAAQVSRHRRCFNSTVSSGTPTLDPEESSDWDAGVEQRLFNRLSVSATYFNRETDDLIDFVSCSGVRSPRCTAQPGGYYENVQRASSEGYEIGLTAQIVEKVRFDANYTGLDARNESRGTANFGKHLARRPNDSANAQLTIDWRIPLTTTLAAQYVGKSFDTVANTFVLEDYTLVDLRAAYRFSQSVEVYGRIENAFDEDYATVRRYGSIGRGYYVGMRVTL